ncbi:hypothetical protein ACLBKU_17515 [Erythrobacter sp. NE805]|uniref:hypothetical protein n=1 Tax=Erythrobacter sp. NE805 TaxID=3389875 RepID=UPI00396B06F3
MNGVDWFDAHPGYAGFGRITATRWAFRSILNTMMPLSIIFEFFGDCEVWP